MYKNPYQGQIQEIPKSENILWFGMHPSHLIWTMVLSMNFNEL